MLLAHVGPGHSAACLRHEAVADGAVVYGAKRFACPPWFIVIGEAQPLLAAHELRKLYELKPTFTQWLLRRERARLYAVDRVSLAIGRAETLGIVGESGCGKSTLGRLLVGMEKPTSGEITFNGVDLAASGGQLRAHRRALQMVFQDPYSTLNPRQKVGSVLPKPFGSIV